MTAVNDAPVATNDSESLTEDASLTSITVLDDDTDADGDSLTVSAISYSGTGTAAINSDNARIDYTPAANFNGTDTITYTVSDGTTTDTGTLTITVTAVNDAPTVVNDTASTDDNTALSGILLLDDDSDARWRLSHADRDPSPTNGSVALIGNTVTYTPTPNTGPNGDTHLHRVGRYGLIDRNTHYHRQRVERRTGRGR